MRFTWKTPDVVDLANTFYCRSRRKYLALEHCLDGYVDANAFEKRSSACFRCPIGQVNRKRFADCGQDDGE